MLGVIARVSRCTTRAGSRSAPEPSSVLRAATRGTSEVLNQMPSTIIDYATLATPPAWIGYDQAAFRRGSIVINICGECEGVAVALEVARRLKCGTVRTLCARHTAQRIARFTGETL